MEQAMLDFDIPEHLRREFSFQTAGILPPNGILFGFNTIKKVAEKAAQLGGRKAVLVTDKNMVHLGYAGMVQESLGGEGLKVEVFDQVEPDPKMKTAETLCEIVRRKKFDLVVGLGGGSPLDMAKMTSILATHPQTPLQLMEGKQVQRAGLKKILIPTTSGSGSEVSMFFVASAGKEKYTLRTPYAYPEVAIIDPGLTLSAPPEVTVSSGLDALTHAIESLMNRLANPLYDCLGLRGIELISGHLGRATFNGQDMEARYYMSMGSTLAMLSLNGTGGLYAHSLSYALATFHPITHGVGCALALPHTMAFNLPVIASKLAAIARAMGENTESLSLQAAAAGAIERVRGLMVDLKIPLTLKEMGYQYEDLPRMAEICVSRYPRVNNPRPMSRDDCLALLEKMWNGSI